MILQKIKNLTHQRHSERTFWIVFVVSIIVAGVGGMVIGLRQSLWFDDAFSVLLATKPVGQLIHLTSIDVHPPTYYLLLKLWGNMFGWGDFAMRSLSVLFTMGALAVGGLLVRKMFNSRIAVGAMLLLMMAPLITRYGFEVRMYAMASFIGISATYALYSAWKSRGVAQRRWLILYGVLVVLGLYTLYATALLWIAHVVWLCLMAWRRRQHIKSLLPYAVTYVISAILFLPWLPVFKAQLTNGALGPIVEPLKLDQLVGVFSFNVIYEPTALVNVVQTAILLAVVGVFIWATPRALKQLKNKDGELALLTVYLGVPIIIMMIVSLAKAMYVERYFSHVAIGLILLGGVILMSAVGTVKKHKWQACVALVIVYGAMIVGMINLVSLGNYSFQHQYTPTAREVAASIKPCPNNTMILADGPYVATEIWYYMPHCEIYFTSSQDKLGGGFGPLNGSKYQVKDAKTLTNQRILYISYGQPMHPLPEWYVPQSTHTFGSMDVTQYNRAILSD